MVESGKKARTRPHSVARQAIGQPWGEGAKKCPWARKKLYASCVTRGTHRDTGTYEW